MKESEVKQYDYGDKQQESAEEYVYELDYLDGFCARKGLLRSPLMAVCVMHRRKEQA